MMSIFPDTGKAMKRMERNAERMAVLGAPLAHSIVTGGSEIMGGLMANGLAGLSRDPRSGYRFLNFIALAFTAWIAYSAYRGNTHIVMAGFMFVVLWRISKNVVKRLDKLHAMNPQFLAPFPGVFIAAVLISVWPIYHFCSNDSESLIAMFWALGEIWAIFEVSFFLGLYVLATKLVEDDENLSDSHIFPTFKALIGRAGFSFGSQVSILIWAIAITICLMFLTGNFHKCFSDIVHYWY